MLPTITLDVIVRPEDLLYLKLLEDGAMAVGNIDWQVYVDPEMAPYGAGIERGELNGKRYRVKPRWDDVPGRGVVRAVNPSLFMVKAAQFMTDRYESQIADAIQRGGPAVRQLDRKIAVSTWRSARFRAPLGRSPFLTVSGRDVRSGQHRTMQVRVGRYRPGHPGNLRRSIKLDRGGGRTMDL